MLLYFWISVFCCHKLNMLCLTWLYCFWCAAHISVFCFYSAHHTLCLLLISFIHFCLLLKTGSSYFVNLFYNAFLASQSHLFSLPYWLLFCLTGSLVL
jgi:hypothetical protein